MKSTFEGVVKVVVALVVVVAVCYALYVATLADYNTGTPLPLPS